MGLRRKAGTSEWKLNFQVNEFNCVNSNWKWSVYGINLLKKPLHQGFCCNNCGKLIAGVNYLAVKSLFIHVPNPSTKSKGKGLILPWLTITFYDLLCLSRLTLSTPSRVFHYSWINMTLDTCLRYGSKSSWWNSQKKGMKYLCTPLLKLRSTKVSVVHSEEGFWAHQKIRKC